MLILDLKITLLLCLFLIIGLIVASWRLMNFRRATLIHTNLKLQEQKRSGQQQAFVGKLAHELRTPLTALIAHSEVIGSEQTSEAVRQTSLQTVKRETQRMSHLVRDMLELYRLETADDLQLQLTNLVLLAEEAIAQIILQAENLGIGLNFKADSHLPPVLANPDRMKQVFLNLIDNAIKYCRQGDEVTVSIKGRTDGIFCAIEDSGPGISSYDLPHVTKLLYRSRKDIEGSGIGLALVNEILHRHNAVLTIKSTNVGLVTGTSCSWFLPYAKSNSARLNFYAADSSQN